jgi:hypothetical protein
VAANHIVVEFLVDGRTVHSAVDTVMDKRLYQGHTTEMKNEIQLKDFSVDVPAGLRHAKLIVRNADLETFREDFDPEPLNLVLPFGNLLRLDVGITKGKLRMGKAKLYRVQ